jgi:hypothetical protein
MGRPITAADRVLAATPCLTSWSLALLPLGLRHRRRPRWRLARQPSIAVLFSTSFWVLFLVQRRAWVRPRPQPFWHWTDPITGAVNALARPVGLTVAVVWIIMALGRRWHGRADWVELTGRLLGVGWIVIFLVQEFRA